MANARVDPSHLASLQATTTNIRNFCILAHVDHGKTTLSDSLVCSNGVISPKLAGKLRFLDSTEEEQRRGITMHSSAIALLYRMEDKSSNSNPTEASEYLINLVDSPGHIDFSSDVSTATRLCDGALIVVDVLEGLCTQTRAVLFKALKERLKPCLVLNKIDRLALEMKLTTTEAFHHLRRIIENVNALAFSLVISELRLIAELEGGDPNIEINEDSPFVTEWNFSPEKGNVIFASAYDCWGFNTAKFANIWSKKLEVNKAILTKYFFEDYAFNSKTKKIVKCDPGDSSKPMFASMILDPIWQIYDAAITQADPGKAAKMAQRGLNVDIPPRDINERDPRLTAQAIFRRWLPLPDAVLRMVVRSMPSPVQAQKNRISNLMLDPRERTSVNPLSLARMEKVYHDVEKCNTALDSDVTVFISKMTPIRAGDLSTADLNMLREKRKALAEQASDPVLAESLYAPLDSSSEVFMALGRVFSGVISRNNDLYILGNRHDPSALNDATILSIEAGQYMEAERTSPSVIKLPAGSFGVYICLGPSAFAVDQVYAGNIVGIIGIEAHVFKTGTISSTWATLPMKVITFQAKPMVKVALEPLSHHDLPKLEKGLESLYQYDPVVEVGIDDNGQHTMTCLGELHLELCLKTLIDKFAKCEIKASEPLVSFRETVLKPENMSSQSSPATWLPPPWRETPFLDRASQGRCRMFLSSGNLAIRFRCFPLPGYIAKLLDDNSTQTALISEYLASKESRRSVSDELGHFGAKSFWSKIYQSNEEAIAFDTALESDSQGLDTLQRLVSLGPKSIGPNMLLFDKQVVSSIYSSTVPRGPGSSDTDEKAATSILLHQIGMSEHPGLFLKLWSKIQGAVIAGFQVVTAAGPVMQEPLFGVGYAIEEIEFSYAAAVSGLSEEELEYLHKSQSSSLELSSISLSTQESSPSGMIMSGQLLSEVKDTLRLCMLSCPMRVVEAVYACELQCDQMQLGNLYSVLARRRAVVTKEDIIDGTTLFLLSADLPVMESFSFAQELLNKTSGSGTAPQLRFSHWQTMEQDPFWRAKTEEELEEFGDQNNELNKVRVLVDKVRKRKGLAIEEKIVAFAEKQRTLSRR